MANEPERVSMLDLQADTEEIMGYKPDADANASIPPFPAGTYPVMVTYLSEEADKVWAPGVATDGQKFYKTAVILELYGTPEGAYDGRRITHYVNTYTSKYSNTNSVQALLQGLGKGQEIISIKSRGGLAQALNDALMNGQGAAEAVFDWEARYAIETPPNSGVWDEKFNKRGMTRFSKRDDGSYDPIAMYGDIEVPARNYLVRFVNPDKVASAGAHALTASHTTGAPQPVQPAQAPKAAPTPPVHRAPVPAPSNSPAGPPVPAAARQR